MRPSRKIINKSLYATCFEFVKKAIKTLKEYSGEFGVAPIEFATSSLDIQLPESILCDKLLEYQYDVNNLYEENKERIESIPEFQKCIILMRRDNVIQKHINNLVGNRVIRQRIDVEEYLRLLAVMVIRKVMSFKFSKKIFDNQFNEMEIFFHSDKIINSSLVLIENFMSKQKEITLEKDLSIIELPKWKSLLFWYNLPTHFKYEFLYTIIHSNHAIQVSWEDKKIIGKNPPPTSWQTPFEKIQAYSSMVVSTLRVFKEGSIYQNSIIPGFLMGDLLIGGPILQTQKRFLNGRVYILSKKESKQFENFWRKVKNVYQKKSYKIGIKRFATSIEKRYNLEDKIIDFLIAFESLFLSDTGKGAYRGEKRFRLALRISFFLASKNIIKRKRIFNEMKKAYDIRSAIVHGGDVMFQGNWTHL